MALVALTVMSSVIVTNMYSNTKYLNNRFLSLFMNYAGENKITDSEGGKSSDKKDADKPDRSEENVQVGRNASCKEMALLLDKICFYIWITLYLVCCTTCLLFITL